jgi:hypothetical protein
MREEGRGKKKEQNQFFKVVRQSHYESANDWNYIVAIR